MPCGDIQHTHINRLAVHDTDVHLCQQIGLILIPECQHIIAVGNIGDLEGAIDIAAANIDRGVGAAGVDQRDQRLLDILDDMPTWTKAQRKPAELRREFANPYDGTLNRAARRGRGVVAAGGRGGTGLHLDEAKLGKGEGLGALDELGVVAIPTFDGPNVPIVPAFERAGLIPDLPVRRGDGGRITVRPQIRNGDHTICIAEAVPADLQDKRFAISAKDQQATGIMLISRANRIAIPVGGDMIEHVINVTLEASQVGLAGVIGTVGLQVIPDGHANSDQRQRVGLHTHGNETIIGNRGAKPLTIDLEAIDVTGDRRRHSTAGDVKALGHDRDHVAMVRVVVVGRPARCVNADRLAEGCLVALRDDFGAGAALDRVNAGPLAIGRIGRIAAERLGLTGVIRVFNIGGTQVCAVVGWVARVILNDEPVVFGNSHPICQTTGHPCAGALYPQAQHWGGGGMDGCQPYRRCKRAH